MELLGKDLAGKTNEFLYLRLKYLLVLTFRSSRVTFSFGLIREKALSKGCLAEDRNNL